MTSQFDQFLATALAPEERVPDRLFVARVQARVRLEQQLASERRAIASRLGVELAGIAAIAAGLVLLAEAAVVREFAFQSPALAAGGLIAAFALVVVTFGSLRRPGLVQT